MSGLFTMVSTLLITVIGDSSQNNWFGGDPRANVTYPNGPGSEPALGAPLTGQALTQANTLRNYYQARIFWLGNDILANKYGTTMPTALTPVEEEMWARQLAVLGYTVARINALLGETMGLVQGKPESATEKKPESATEKKPESATEKKPESATEKKLESAPQMSLAERYDAATEQERAELALKILGIGSHP